MTNTRERAWNLGNVLNIGNISSIGDRLNTGSMANRSGLGAIRAVGDALSTRHRRSAGAGGGVSAGEALRWGKPTTREGKYLKYQK